MRNVSEMGWRDPQRAAQTHLHVDLDRERDALLQLLGLLIEVLAELPDGDSFLENGGRIGRTEGNKHGKMAEDCFKMYEIVKKKKKRKN